MRVLLLKNSVNLESYLKLTVDMKFVTEDNFEFDTLEEAEYWKENKKKLIKKPRADKGKKRPTYRYSQPRQFVSYQRKAIVNKVSFSLSVDEVMGLLSQDCGYCGGSYQISIQRINPKAGYDLENVIPCCVKCSTMQSIYSSPEFLRKVKEIYQHKELGK